MKPNPQHPRTSAPTLSNSMTIGPVSGRISAIADHIHNNNTTATTTNAGTFIEHISGNVYVLTFNISCSDPDSVEEIARRISLALPAVGA